MPLNVGLKWGLYVIARATPRNVTNSEQMIGVRQVNSNLRRFLDGSHELSDGV
jgi:hypothetical protein